MNITVNISRENKKKTIELSKNAIVQDVLEKINLKPDTIVIMKENKPIPIDEELKDGEELTIIQVSSGG